MVTTLFGTVLNKFIERPLYNPLHVSSCKITLVVWITPRYLLGVCEYAEGGGDEDAAGREFKFVDDDSAKPINRFCVCNRVRITS